MDNVLQTLKREASTSNDAAVLRRYINALERVLETGEFTCKTYVVMGHEGDLRPVFFCIAHDIEDAKRQFEEAAQQESWGKAIWDFIFEGSKAGDTVDGWMLPLSLLVRADEPLPLQWIPSDANILTIEEYPLNSIKEFV